MAGKSTVRRFWDKVDRGDDDECWEWQACVESQWGYGQFSVDGDARSAHRVAYKLEKGSIGDMFVLHTCDNRTCVNPNHLYLGTHEDNMNDRDERGRTYSGKGEDNSFSSLNDDEVAVIKWKIQETQITLKEIAGEYGVSLSAVGEISRGSTWTHVDAQNPEVEA